MILLSRVDDRKAVLGMFNAAHEMVHGGHDPQFPRLGQMIVDYDPPLKKLSEEFVPHARTLNRALVSLAAIYPRRNLNAEQWRSAQMLSLTANPNQAWSFNQYLFSIHSCLDFTSLGDRLPIWRPFWHQGKEDSTFYTSGI